MGSEIPKQFLPVHHVPIIVHTLRKFLQADPEIRLILVLPRDHISLWEKVKSEFLPEKEVNVVYGGETRFNSVKNGLEYISEDGIVAIHDAVRPCVSVKVIRECYQLAEEKGSAIVTVPLKDSIRKLFGDTSSAVDRSAYCIVQTPQTFRVRKIQEAFRNATHNRFTDDASVAEASGEDLHLLEGNYQNIKVTTPEDLEICAVFLSNQRLKR